MTIVVRTLFLLILLGAPALAVGDAKHIVIDTERYELTVYDGEEPVIRFDDFAIGRGGASKVRQRGDRTTPLGEFRVAWINHDSDFHLFFGLDYPNFDHASRAYEAGYLSQDEFLDIGVAHMDRRLPPQGTAIGGHIGIHGLGEADPELHRRVNWTQGCVALTNDEIDQLSEFVEIGTPVAIR